jgi:hypothetical protein
MRSFFFLAIAAAVLGGLFLLFKPARLAEDTRVATPPQVPATTVPIETAPQPAAGAPQPGAAPATGPREVALVVKGG